MDLIFPWIEVRFQSIGSCHDTKVCLAPKSIRHQLDDRQSHGVSFHIWHYDDYQRPSLDSIR